MREPLWSVILTATGTVYKNCCVDYKMVDMNNDFNLRFGTITKS